MGIPGFFGIFWKGVANLLKKKDFHINIYEIYQLLQIGSSKIVCLPPIIRGVSWAADIQFVEAEILYA